jgi:hypothetical protein
MLTYRLLVNISLLLGVIFHFIYFFAFYGPLNSIYDWSFFIAWVTVFLLVFLYLITNWKSYIEGNSIILFYKLLLIIILISLLRSLVSAHGLKELKWVLFDSYQGLSLFPVLFFVVGCNSKYFSNINKILLVYCFLAFLCSLLFLKSVDELAVFLLMPLFYVIITYPLQSKRDRIITVIISISVILISMTHRAGMIRILLSYFIVLVYFVILNVKISKKFIYILVFCLLLVPFYFLYTGIKGNSIFQSVLGESTAEYSQEDLRVDTRTFLYSEVLQDLKLNRAFAFGKGIYGGYASDSFQTWNRKGVEVGFLQILLKSGIAGFLVYFGLIFSAIFRALGQSKNLFLKCLALMLAGYFLMCFIENVLAFDLLNIVVWLAVGMCHSKDLLRLNDHEIRSLYMNGKI